MPLTPYETYRESGIQWLGKIPAHWEVKRIKNIIKSINSGGTPKTEKEEYWNGNIPWVSSKDMKFDIIHSTVDTITEIAIKESATRLIETNSLLLVVRSGILKHSLPVAINSVPVAINQDLKAIKTKKEVAISYFFGVLKV